MSGAKTSRMPPRTENSPATSTTSRGSSRRPPGRPPGPRDRPSPPRGSSGRPAPGTRGGGPAGSGPGSRPRRSGAGPRRRATGPGRRGGRAPRRRRRPRRGDRSQAGKTAGFTPAKVATSSARSSASPTWAIAMSRTSGACRPTAAAASGRPSPRAPIHRPAPAVLQGRQDLGETLDPLDRPRQALQVVGRRSGRRRPGRIRDHRGRRSAQGPLSFPVQSPGPSTPDDLVVAQPSRRAPRGPARSGGRSPGTRRRRQAGRRSRRTPGPGPQARASPSRIVAYGQSRDPSIVPVHRRSRQRQEHDRDLADTPAPTDLRQLREGPEVGPVVAGQGREPWVVGGDRRVAEPPAGDGLAARRRRRVAPSDEFSRKACQAPPDPLADRRGPSRAARPADWKLRAPSRTPDTSRRPGPGGRWG